MFFVVYVIAFPVCVHIYVTFMLIVTIIQFLAAKHVPTVDS